MAGTVLDWELSIKYIGGINPNTYNPYDGSTRKTGLCRPFLQVLFCITATGFPLLRLG